ncbi:MAG: hypothetical protein NT105_05595 [Verrucomicrobia bacterium]|nr:hypothetical protein [Verrucomicrobiota bacterium]
MLAKPICISLLLAVALTSGAGLAFAEEKPESLIPFDKLDAAAQARVRQVVPGYTLYRNVRMSKPMLRARYDIFEYLISHLGQSSIVAQSLNVADYRRERQPDGSYFGDNRKGTVGYLWPLRVVPGERLYFGEGADKEDAPQSGRAILLFRYRELQPGVLKCELHGFVKVDGAVERFCMFLFRPFIMGAVDRHLREVVDAPMRVAEEATADPAKVLKRMDSMQPEDAAKLKEFRALLARPETKS